MYINYTAKILSKMKKGPIFLVVILVFLTSCSYFPGIPGIGKGPTQERQVPRGIGINFVEGFPPDKIFEESPFGVVVKLINYGADAVNGKIELSDGISDSFGGVTEDVSESFDLEGNEGNPNAGFDETEKSFEGINPYANIEEGMSAYFQAIATVEYKYKSVAKLCINGYNSKKCPQKESIAGNFLGMDAITSPVAVARVESFSSATKEGAVSIGLKINIANVGDGMIIDDEIKSLLITMGDFGDVKCDADSKLRLKNIKEKTITCSVAGSIEEGKFLSSAPLVISYNYNYKTIQDYGPVEIVKLKKN